MVEVDVGDTHVDDVLQTELLSGRAMLLNLVIKVVKDDRVPGRAIHWVVHDDLLQCLVVGHSYLGEISVLSEAVSVFEEPKVLKLS